MRSTHYIILLLLLLLQSSCKKLVEAGAPQSTSSVADVYRTDATAAAVLSGIYINMSNSNSTEFSTGGFTSMSLFPSLSADELTLYEPGTAPYSNYYSNALTSATSPYTAGECYWKIIYPVIFTTNSAIEGLEKASGLTPAIKNQLLGEARFMRAFCYFYLVNLYGPVPLVIGTDWKQNTAIGRTPVEQVYQQIISDLKNAQRLMSGDYLGADILTPDDERVRPSKWTATALLARAYLFTGDWANAEVQSTALINNQSLFSLSELYDTFNKYSMETIWQLRSVGISPYANTGEGMFFILPFYGPDSYSNPVYMSDGLAGSFEADDQRKLNWVGSVTSGITTYYYPYKYKYGVMNIPYSLENCIVMRLAEQYLIRAEARTQLNNLTGAQKDINVIRSRAGLGNTSAGDKAGLLAAIMQERKAELFTEWGHRWFDLKRTGKVDEVMGAATLLKGGTWQNTDQWYPIPASEIKLAPQLVQNAGYLN